MKKNYFYNELFSIIKRLNFFIIIVSFIVGFLFNSWRGIALGTLVTISVIVNCFTKSIFKLLIGNKNLPIFGKGTRPKGQCVLSSYGMDSGHTQGMAFISTLAIIGLYDKHKKKNDNFINIKIGFLVGLVFIMGYSRVYIEKCHTIQQTIVGGIIGITLALVLNKYLPNPFKRKKKKFNF